MNVIEKNQIQLIIMPIEWLDGKESIRFSEKIRDDTSNARLVTYGDQAVSCSEVILLGADNYFELEISQEQCGLILKCEYDTVMRTWRREARRFAAEKARNQLMYARIKDSFENTTIDMINRKFHFRFHEGLFRTILLRVDYTNKNKEVFDWFYMFDEAIVAEVMDALQEISYDIYVEFRMNGPMFYCNYAEDNDEMLFRVLEQLYERLFEDIVCDKSIQLSARIGSAYRSVEGFSESREETYNAYQEYFEREGYTIWLFDQNEYANLWNNRQAQKIYEKLCRAGVDLDRDIFCQCVEELKKINFKVISGLLPRYIDYFFAENEKLIASFTNCSHARKKMIQSVNFYGTKEGMLENFLKQGTGMIDSILRVAPRGIRVIHMTERYVTEHYSKKISVAELADYLQLNPSYFSHLFVTETGRSFSDYLLKYRMDKAVELLSSNNMTVGEIAEKVGYADQRYFSRMFRKVMGKTPTEFRKNIPFIASSI